jgi:hypothetical protein
MAGRKRKPGRIAKRFIIFDRINDLDGKPLRMVRSSLARPARTLEMYVGGSSMEGDEVAARFDVERARWLMNILRRFVEGREYDGMDEWMKDRPNRGS